MHGPSQTVLAPLGPATCRLCGASVVVCQHRRGWSPISQRREAWTDVIVLDVEPSRTGRWYRSGTFAGLVELDGSGRFYDRHVQTCRAISATYGATGPARRARLALVWPPARHPTPGGDTEGPAG